MRGDPPLLRCALLGLGVGVLGDAWLLLGLASESAFAAPALVFPAAAAMALAAVTWIGVREILPRAAVARWTFLGACGLLLALLVPMSLVPPVARDELTHHLAMPALYVEARRVVEVPFADQAYYPMLLEMFYTPLLAWLPDQATKLLHLLFALASAAVVGLAARSPDRPLAGAIGFALILFTPVVALLACTAYVDLGLLFYTALAIAALLRWYADGSWTWLALSALAAGFSGTSKYNGLVAIALLAIGAVLAPGRRSLAKLSLIGSVYVALALVPMSPWLAKNWVQTGNPTFPLFNGLFRGRPLPQTPSVDLLTKRRVLYDESWLEMAAIPVRLFTTGREGDPARFDGVFQPLMLLGIFAALGARVPRERRLLLGFAASYFLIAFFQTSLRARYIVPVLPPLALITAPVLADLLRRQRALAALALAGGAAFALAHVADKWRELDPLSYLGGEQTRDQYIARFVAEYPVLEIVNRDLPADARLHLAFLGTRSYYCRRPFTYDYYFSGMTVRRYVESSRDSAEVLQRFRDAGITHLVAADDLFGRYLLDNLDPPALERWQAFASAHLQRRASAQGVSLYAIEEG